MGLFGEAAARFKRTRWKSVQMLAEELFGVFSSGLDITPNGITINQQPGATIPPIQINQPADSTTPAIQITKGNTTTTFGGDAGGGGSGGGGVDLGTIEFPGQVPADKPAAVPVPSNNPLALHGRVQGRAGAGGSVYKVQCWGKDPTTNPSLGVLDVAFPDVDPDDTIPAGQRCPVIAFPLTVNGATTITFAIGYVPVFMQPEA